MKLLRVLVFLLCASCAATPTVGPRPNAAPVKAAIEKSRLKVVAAREGIVKFQVSAREGKDALVEADKVLTAIVGGKLKLDLQPVGVVKRYVEIGIAKWDESIGYIALADTRAKEALDETGFAKDHAVDLEKQIAVRYENEKKLSSLVNKYEPFWVQGHKWWGLGAIGLGIAILLKHIFILIAVLAILALAFWILSVTLFPWLKPVVTIVTSWIAALFRRKS